MKKLSSILCLSLLLLASGCSDATTNVNNDDKVLISVGDEEITKGDIYTTLLATGNINPVTNEIKLKVASKAVKTTDALEKSAKETMETQKNSMGEDEWKAYLKTNGYKNDDAFYKNYALPNQKANELKTTYINERFKELAEEFKIKKVQVIAFSDKTKLEEAQKAMKKNDNFEELAKQYGMTDTFNGTTMVYTSKGTLPASVWNEVAKVKKGKISEAIPDVNTGYYYIVKMVESDATKFKEEAKSALSSLSYTDEDGLVFDDVIFKYFLDKYDFSVHDATVYAALINNSAKYAKD